jgi:ABC-type dipeptide/oligopeptide/nickel transport system ATPase component
MNHIINVRGTNGSGKTTTVRTLMNYLTHHKDATTSNGVFFHVYTTPAGEYVAFIGKYEGAVTGGVDRVRNVRDVVEACREIIPYAHIVMEGLLMSGLQQLTKDIADACVDYGQFHALTLDTTKEKCIAQTLNRRALAGNDKPFDPGKSLVPKYRAVELAHTKMKSWGMDSKVVSQRDALIEALQLLSIPFNPQSISL